MQFGVVWIEYVFSSGEVQSVYVLVCSSLTTIIPVIDSACSH